MTTQLTIKQSLQADFDAYIKKVETSKLSRKIEDMEVFKTSWSYGDLDFQVTPKVVDGIIFVAFAFGEYGCASGYHPFGRPETYILERALEVLVEMKKQLGHYAEDPKYSGYQMGEVIDEIKKSLLSI